MAYNTVSIKKDVDGKPIPQHYNEIENKYEASEGLNGSQKVILCDGEGNAMNIDIINSNIDSNISSILSKLDELIGVVS